MARRKDFKVTLWEPDGIQRVWHVHFMPNLKEDGEDCFGLCDHEARIIYVDRGIKTVREVLDTLLHEGNHAAVGRIIAEDAIKHMEQNYQALREGLENA